MTPPAPAQATAAPPAPTPTQPQTIKGQGFRALTERWTTERIERVMELLHGGDRAALAAYLAANVPPVPHKDDPPGSIDLKGLTFEPLTYKGDLATVKFEGVNFSFAKFSNVNLRATQFIKCKMFQVLFEDAYLSQATFTDCDMTGVDCLSCHTGHGSKRAGLMPEFAHPGFADRQCTKCHGSGQPTATNLTAAPNDLCMRCHDLARARTSEEHVHPPVQKGQCLSCHSPHGSSQKGLLTASTDQLCRDCHQQVLQESHLSHGHAPSAKGECSACHEPHRGPGIGMLRQKPQELCRGCHQDLMKRIESSDAHPPVARGQCLTCHASHGSDLPGMTRRPGAALCLVCHDAKTPTMVARHAGVDLPKAACTSCHDPHTQPKGQHGLLKTAKHVPFMRGDCSACHVSRGNAALKKTGADLCLSCHPKGGWTGRAHTHQPVLEGPQCLNCHGPHGGSAQPSLKVGGDELCFQCHDRHVMEGVVQHGALKKGCVTCHDPHGSDGPHLLKQATVEHLCMSCHSDLSKHFHPSTSRKADPTGRPLTCTSCHQPHAAKFKALLDHDPNRDLCVQCHDPSIVPGDGSGHGGQGGASAPTPKPAHGADSTTGGKR